MATILFGRTLRLLSTADACVQPRGGGQPLALSYAREYRDGGIDGGAGTEAVTFAGTQSGQQQMVPSDRTLRVWDSV